MILRSLIIVAVLIGAVLAFAATRPNTFLIERSLSIKAPPEKIFVLINNFHDLDSMVAAGHRRPFDEKNVQWAGKRHGRHLGLDQHRQRWPRTDVDYGVGRAPSDFC